MRMKSRSYLHYAPVPGGVYFSGARRQFVMRGPQLLFTIADVCVPLLERGTTEDELVGALGSERARPVVQQLAAALRGHEMLLDLDRLTVPEPPPDVRERYAEALTYLEAVSDDPYALFDRFRAATVLLCGPPQVVLPAARGLHRAGAGRLVVATPDPAAVASAANRLGADVLSLSPDVGASVGSDVDAVLCCLAEGAAADEDLLLAWAGLPEGVPLAPVWYGERVVVAGPVLGQTITQSTWRAFTERVRSWAEAEHVEPAARPTAAALAGALAGQLLFETLTAGAVPGQAHVVYGSDLTAEQVVVDRPGPPDRRWHHLDDAQPAPLPEPDDTVNAVTAMTARWTGLFALTPGADLPQIPLALREAEQRAAPPDPVVAWGRRQQSATISVALAALRGRCDGPGVGAAGLTEERWLLDGVLRLLADRAVPLRTVAVQDTEPETFQMWQSLDSLGAGQVTVTLCETPGLDWRLGRVDLDGQTLGLGWGADEPEALAAAMGTALARVQTRHVSGVDKVAAGVHTDVLLAADDAVVASLAKQVCAYAAGNGVRFRGRCQRTDPLLGELPVWFGPVVVEKSPVERTDA